MSKAPTLWRSTAQAAILGAAGAAVMLAAELLLFPGLVRAVEIDADATCVRSCPYNHCGFVDLSEECRRTGVAAAR